MGADCKSISPCQACCTPSCFFPTSPCSPVPPISLVILTSINHQSAIGSTSPIIPSSTAMRARKRTETKGKVQPCTATRANTKAGRGTPARNAKCAQSRSSPVSDSYERSLQAHDAVTTQQSAEVVQTFLFSAVSTVLWMRDMLPDEYFRTAFYASINKHCSYHEFTHGNDVEVIAQGDRSRPKGYHLRVLKRNVSTRGNQLIEWLVSGLVSYMPIPLR